MSKELSEAQMMDILLSFKGKGYNLQDTEDPATMKMNLGTGYTLFASIKDSWTVEFDDGIQETTYNIESTKIPFTMAKDALKLCKEYQAECKRVLSEIPEQSDVLDIEEKMRILEALENGEIEKHESKPTQEPAKKTEWKKGGYSAKVQDAAYEEVEPVRQVTSRRPSRTIRGLTPRLAECGKIKIGRKGEVKTSTRGNQFRPPEKIDHFIVTTMEKTGNDDFAPDDEIMKKLGANCKEIPVRLPYDDPSLNFPTSYAYYDSAACQCRGDGVTAITAAGECIDCNPETCQYIKDKKCKPNGVLSVILDDAPRVGGVYKFRTTGWNSINNIFSSMEFIRGLTNGLLAFLPLSLTLTPKNTVVPGTKTPTTIYMVNLEYRGSLREMATAIQQTMSTRALTQYSVKDFEKLAEEALALPEAPEECKAIVEEFYPETVRA